MNLSQLQYFCKLAELQHYTKAAEQLYITQPTLSNSIARLEDELGVPLFEREGRNVRLTKYGREFNDYARAALESLERGKEVAQAQAGQLGGHIDIGTIYTIQSDYLPALIRSYRALYGAGPTMGVHQGLTRALIADLEADRYDVAFTAFMPDKEHLMFMPVLYQQLALTVHASHPLAQQESATLAEVRNQHIVTYRNTSPLGAEVEQLLNAAQLTPAELYDDEITLASMVAANDQAVGITLNTVGLDPFPDLVRIPLSDVPHDFHGVYLVYKKSGYRTPAVQHFIDLARDFTWPAVHTEPEE